MSQFLSSRVIIEEEEPRVRTIQETQTAIVSAVGVTERGPIGVPTLVSSFDEFQSVFGGFTANSDLATAVDGFFDEGGQFMYIVRVVHYSDPSVPTSKVSAKGSVTVQTPSTGPTSAVVTGTETEPFDLEPGNLTIDVDGGGGVAAAFTAVAAEETAVNAGTYALADGETLTVSVDQGSVQTITFLAAEFSNIAAATASEVVDVINAKISGAFADLDGGNPRITSDTRGTDSYVQITGGTANTALGFPTVEIQGTGNVGNIDFVTVAEVKAVVEAAVAGVTVTDVSGAVKIASDTTGPSSSLQISSSDIQTAIGLSTATATGTDGSPVNTLKVEGRYDGDYTDDLQVKIEAATNGEADSFNITVLEDGIVVEVYANANMDDNDADYVETVTASSQRLTFTDLDASAVQRPANGTYSLTGGDAGLTGLADADFLGAVSTVDGEGNTGMRALDVVDDSQILIIPGQATSVVHNGMVNYCENVRNKAMFAILDCPAGLSAVQMRNYVLTTASLKNSSEFGAIYWPRPLVPNPNPTVFGKVANIAVPCSGLVAGVYARTDANTTPGVFQSPAGTEVGVLTSVVGFETTETYDERKRDLLYPENVNLLTKKSGTQNYIDGSRTLNLTGDFPYINQRRGVIFIEQSLAAGSEFARHRNNDQELRRTLERSYNEFLVKQMVKGAFRSRNDPSKAFFVEMNERLNPPSVVQSGKLIGRIGLAMNAPAEFIVLRFSRDTRAIDSTSA